MKKILCLIDILGIGGGAERQMALLAQFLLEKGYRVDLATYHDTGTCPDNLIWRSDLKITHLRSRNSRFSKLMSVRRLIKAVGGYDCIIAYKDGPCIIGCLLKLLGGKFRLIVSERNTNQSISKKDRVKFLLYRLADYIVPNSHSQEDFIKKNFHKLSDKVVAITNFTDTAHFCPIDTPTNEKSIIMTVGRITPQKNVLKYLEAIKLIKQDGYGGSVHFDWYGDAQSGDDTYKATCLRRRIELGIEDMIEFHPATTAIAHCYQMCDIFCLPSIYEGFPNVLCEAMSCGKPIVCSRVCDNPRIVRENTNSVLFNPNDINDIYLALKKMIEQPKSAREEWGKASREIAETIFSKDAFVRNYIQLIESKLH